MHASRLFVTVAVCAVLSGCGDGFDKKAASECVQSAISRQNNKTEAIGGIFGNKGFAPTLKVRDLKIGDCQKGSPGQHLCLVEYRIEFLGGDQGLMALMQLGGALSGTDLNSIQQTYWQFTKGPQTYGCQLVRD